MAKRKKKGGAAKRKAPATKRAASKRGPGRPRKDDAGLFPKGAVDAYKALGKALGIK